MGYNVRPWSTLKSGQTAWSKIGFNPDVGTTEEDIWVVGGVCSPPANASQMQVYSTSANDSATGDGIRSLIIYYLDGNGTSKTETITPLGANNANTTASDITYVNGFRAVTCGANNVAAGTISLRNTAGNITFTQIALGYTRARNVNYKVPTDKVLSITSFTMSVHSATKGVRFTTRATYDADVATIRSFFIPYNEIAMTNGWAPRYFEHPTVFPAGVRIKVSAISDATGAVCSCTLKGYLENA